MNSEYLDKKLKIARNQSEQFFTKFNFEQSRKLVYKRTEDNTNVKVNLLEKLLNNKLLLKGTVTFFIMIIIVFGARQIGNDCFIENGTPILQQSIQLDNNTDYLVNYFIVDNPNKDNNLLAILWKKDLRGDYQVVYSSMMENTNMPNPVTIMNMPFSESKFALVSSRNKDKNFIHYRFIKYSNDSVMTYLEENYVTEGKIEINNGMLVEERIEPNDYYLQKNNKPISKDSKVYRYFVPVELKSDGNLTLSTNQIKLKEGAILTLLVEDRIMPLEFEYDNEILSKSDKKISDNETVNFFANFKVKGKGFVNLKIREKNNLNKANELFIEIID